MFYTVKIIIISEKRFSFLPFFLLSNHFQPISSQRIRYLTLTNFDSIFRASCMRRFTVPEGTPMALAISPIIYPLE